MIGHGVTPVRGGLPRSSGAEVFSKDGVLCLVMSAHATSSKNYWCGPSVPPQPGHRAPARAVDCAGAGACRSGSLRSRWLVRVAPGGGSASVSGTLRFVTHYYEEGNVQMHNKKEVAASIIAGVDPGALAAAVVRLIAAAEAKLIVRRRARTLGCTSPGSPLPSPRRRAWRTCTTRWRGPR